MKCLHLVRAFNANPGSSVTCFNRGIQTGMVILSRTRAKKASRRMTRKPLFERRLAAMTEHSEFPEEMEEEHEYEEEELDFTNIDKIYAMDQSEVRRHRERIGQIITMKKFFKTPQQPLTLTCNEKECIKYLHKTDPVQWNINALSESFPATPEAIKKILRTRVNLHPDMKKKLDEKVQRNWELLAKGKLKADPEVIEHLKKFINRREVLLEQIKNAKMYLPEVKPEVKWNNDEMSNILTHYEKAVKKLAKNQTQQKTALLSVNSKTTDRNAERRSSLDVVHEKIDTFKNSRNLEGKESFTLGGMINTYSKPLTLEQLQTKLLHKANKERPLHVTEKAILESTLGVTTKYEQSTKSELADSANSQSVNLKGMSRAVKNVDEEIHFNMRTEKSYEKNFHSKEADRVQLERLRINDEKDQLVLPDERDLTNSQSVSLKGKSGAVKDTDEERFNMRTRKNFYDKEAERIQLEKLIMNDEMNQLVLPDERTEYVSVNDLGKVLNKIYNKPEEGSDGEKKEKKTIDMSDPERLRREMEYFDNQVKDIEGTAFWNKGNTSQQKILMEREKAPLGGPECSNRGNVYSTEKYPEKINTPKSKKGSGVIFRVKDCYYDDDGEFLYRVPGMVK